MILFEDAIQSGGSAKAAIEFLWGYKLHVVEVAVVMELDDLGGRTKVEALGVPLFSIAQRSAQEVLGGAPKATETTSS